MSEQKTLLEHALFYASLGWHVFPLHTLNDGICTCHKKDCDRKGKHPRTMNGRNDATVDTDIIERWWSIWPDANIGIATGKESRIVVIDIDDRDTELGELPDTVEQITGSGGRHLLYKRPEEGEYKTCTNAGGLYKIDSRADGGYIVAPPSLHASGNQYEWEMSSSPIDGLAPNDCPQWWIDHIKKEATASSAATPTWHPDGDLPDNIQEMLAAIPADDYETWRDVGFALHYTDPTDGLSWWDWWSGTADNYDGEAVRREWRNFSRRGHDTNNPITMATILRLAEQHGYTDPAIEHGAEVSAMILDSHQRKIADKIRTSRKTKIDTPSLVPDHGLIRMLHDDMMQSSVRPQPELSIANIICYLGAIMGRKYRTETGLRTNVYAVGLLDSGGGKDHSRKRVNMLAAKSGTGKWIGGSKIASGSALISSLVNHPSKLYQLDEMGFLLQSMTGAKSDPHKRDLMANFMELYSSADSVYRGIEYADQSNRPTKEIYQPNACIYGTSTPDSFWSALTSAESVDGSLARFLIFPASVHRPTRQRPDLTPPDKRIVSAIKALADFRPNGSGNLTDVASEIDNANPMTVTMGQDVWTAWESLDDDMTDRMKDTATRSIYSRVAENAMKLSLIHAVSLNHTNPSIGIDSWLWGQEIALWSANQLASEVAKRIADSPFELACKQAYQIISASGDKGCTMREISRQCSSIRALNNRQRTEVMEVVMNDYGVEFGVVRTNKGVGGRARNAYFVNGC